MLFVHFMGVAITQESIYELNDSSSTEEPILHCTSLAISNFLHFYVQVQRRAQRHTQYFAGTAAAPRSKALRKLGILGQGDYKTFNRLFKKFWGKKSPKTQDEAVMAKYKREPLEAKLKYIQQTSLPSQGKRKVSGIAPGEEERLLTVFYYALQDKKQRGGHDDEDDEDSK